MHRLCLGELEVIHVAGGFFRLDGGTMFGVVPKPLWEREMPADERNRVRLACNCLLLRAPGERVLIDTGFGERFADRERDLYGMEPDPTLRRSLAQAGLSPQDLTLVVLTHLHFDHFGGCLFEENGLLRPAFPNAVHLVQRGEWSDALHNRSTMKSSYRPEELRFLQENAQVRFLDGDAQLTPFLSALVTGGHTEQHQGLLIRSGGQTLAYPGELVPTRAHLRPYWNMSYDMFPYQTLRRKQDFVERACAQGWIVAWDHDPQTPWSRLEKHGERLVAVEL
jgi:glyoxylase-like metal-dependent hydrolase (beta-lactamase superfamily II)